MPTYRLTLEYEGTRYHGWQEQKNARTVAGALRAAIQEVAGPVLDLGGSGRTDRGVHALEQVAHLRLGRVLDPARFVADLNAQLPPDVHVLAAAAASDRFHARHDAIARAYLYQITRRRSAFARRHSWWVKSPLAVRPMADAARLAVGRHDFRQFCERGDEQTSTLVELTRAEVMELGALVLVRFSASHFLWKMVRRLVGALVRVGVGELRLDEFERLVAGEALDPRRGTPAEWTAPPAGLFLERVVYAGDSDTSPICAVTPVSNHPSRRPR